jgi:60 kDa SS-A/Ro ribonucleoprotein
MDSPDPTQQLALISTGRIRARSLEIRQLSRLVPEAWLAKAAVTAAEHGQNKAAAMMLAVLTSRDVELLARVFHRCMLEVETLRRYVAYLRCNGRRSFGSRPRKLIQQWLNRQPAWRLRAEAFGEHRPSLADIVRWTHPRPVDQAHSIVYAWMAGRPTSLDELEAIQNESKDRDDREPIPTSETRVTTQQRRRTRSISLVEGVEL